MRVLWLKIGGLWPLNTGGRLRSFHMLRELSRRHQVVLVTTHGPDDDSDGLVSQLASCERVESVPYAAPKGSNWRFPLVLLRSWLSRHPVDISKWQVAGVRRRVGELLAGGGFDLVVADFLIAVSHVPHPRSVPVVFFAHNVEYMIWRRLRDIEPRRLRRTILDVEWRKMRRSERQAGIESALTIAVSETDRDMLAAEAPGGRVVSVPTGVDVEYFRPTARPEIPNRLVFSGSMDWFPNEDAVLYFVDAILPRVRRELPDATLTIVGRRPSQQVRRLAERPGVQVTGTVDDVRPYVAEAALYIVPLRVGGGTRIKIFEALAMGKAVLSTTVGAEGLDVVPGRHLAIADDPDTFGDAVVDLLRDAAHRASLGAEGRDLVETRYSWASVTRAFEGHLESARHRSPSASGA